MSRPIRHLLPLALVALAVAGCGTSSNHSMRLALAALETPTPTPAASAASKPVSCKNLTASLRPPATIPVPSTMPQGSFMRAIQRRGYLIAGVSAGALDLGYLNPATGQIEGFEIELVRELARAIFGNPTGHYRLLALSVPQRIPFVNAGKVDIVVDAVTITCARKQQVDFSTVYYDAHQRVLVLSSSHATSVRDLAGQPVCAAAGSSSIDVMKKLPDPPKPVGLPLGADCMAALQQGTVAAISTDDSILLGFKAQDPNTRLIGRSLADVPYGMAISKAHPEFVRFVNGVLANLRADGTWRRLYDKWLGHIRGSNPRLPPARYDG
ncbi:MAG TPA: glutamate ABC transporter substrate-binding protein [Solirubrobacteraceae bacterium]|nr:glutamate ABC transporter substrate-binding protein [Solirubrobacteraceae bacterium]